MFKYFFLVAFVGLLSITATKAQVAEDIITESSETSDTSGPIDGIIRKHQVHERIVLDWAQPREGDIFWEKRIWRQIDVREKMNKSFMYPEGPFFTMLKNAVEAGDVTAYNDEKFQNKLTVDDVRAKISRSDTVAKPDIETGEVKMVVVPNDINIEDIKTFRIKEVWYFDSQLSRLFVRIIGIAPIYSKTDEMGNYIGEQVMFWVNYPESRKVFSRQTFFNPGNDASPLSWDDMFEMRFFSSYIIKESNVYDNRLADFPSLKENGVDRLLEGDKIKNEIFNYEQDLWSY